MYLFEIVGIAIGIVVIFILLIFVRMKYRICLRDRTIQRSITINTVTNIARDNILPIDFTTLVQQYKVI